MPAILVQFRTPLMNSFFSSITALGSLTVGLTVLAALILRSRERGLQYLGAFLLAAGTTHLLKQVFKAPRPGAEPLVEALTYGFPSGHATVAFSLAVILSRETEDLDPYLYTVATLVAFSRLYLGLHFLVDVTAGAALGYGLTRLYLDHGPG